MYSLLRFVLFIACIYASYFVNGQSISINEIDTKTKKLYSKAKERINDHQYVSAIEYLQEVQSREPRFLDATLLLAQMHQESYVKDELVKIKYLSQAIEVDSFYDMGALFHLAESHYYLGDYIKAAKCLSSIKAQKAFYKKHKQEIKHLESQVQYATQHKSHSIPIEIKPLEHVNTSEAESFPSITASGDALYYGKLIDGQEDIWLSTRDSILEWNDGRALPPPINSSFNESTQSISSDGKTLVFSACHRSDTYGSCDLYISHKVHDQWQDPQNLGSTINSPSWESQPCLSHDGLWLLFASNRPGGEGGKDLYLSIRKNGAWSQAINLGPQINTAANELAPFLHFSDRDLYFMSDRIQNVGKMDIYWAQGSVYHWDTVIHLPYPINTHLEEASFIASRDGQKAYYSREEYNSKAHYRNMDIFELELPASLRPYPSGLIQGRIVDINGNEIKQAEVEIYGIDHKWSKRRVSDELGEFLLTAALNTRYGIHIIKEGYIPHSEDYYVEREDSTQQAIKEIIITLQREKKSSQEKAPPIILKNVFFAMGSSTLDTGSYKELDKWVTYLKAHPILQIEVQGHTDNVGSKEDNQQLSQSRAQAVQQYFVKVGISESRITAKGFGSTQPIASNDTAAGRRQNRRTSILVYE